MPAACPRDPFVCKIEIRIPDQRAIGEDPQTAHRRLRDQFRGDLVVIGFCNWHHARHWLETGIGDWTGKPRDMVGGERHRSLFGLAWHERSCNTLA